MEIYEVLKLKSKSERHLQRYIRFLSSREKTPFSTEKHHICPKANDMFPEYSSFKKHPWNKKYLTPREHYIAHLLLWKVFGGSQTRAIKQMSGKNKSSRLYASMNEEYKLYCRSRRHSDETKEKIRSSLKGRSHEQSTIEKIRKSKVGVKRAPFSDEAKRNMSAVRKGIPKSAEHKAKIAKAKLAYEAKRRSVTSVFP